MTDHQFSIFFSEALASENREAYVSDWSLSSIWGDAPEDDIPEERIQQLGELWDAAHTSIRDICSRLGISQRTLSYRYGIPASNIYKWTGNVYKCPDYIRLMLLMLTGLYKRPED